MKKLFMLSILIPTLVFAACYGTSAGWAYVKGRRINFWKFGHQYIETNCTARTPFYLWWRGGKVCVGGRIYYRVNGRSGYCKVRKVRT